MDGSSDHVCGGGGLVWESCIFFFAVSCTRLGCTVRMKRHPKRPGVEDVVVLGRQRIDGRAPPHCECVGKELVRLVAGMRAAFAHPPEQYTRKEA